MNEKAKELLAQMMQRVMDGADFAVQEIPEVVEQLLMWNMVESIIWCVAAAFLFTAWVCTTRMFWKTDGWGYDSGGFPDGDAMYVYTFVTFVSGVVFILLFDLDWLNIWIAPKLYLLEYGAGLIK